MDCPKHHTGADGTIETRTRVGVSTNSKSGSGLEISRIRNSAAVLVILGNPN